MPRKKKTEVLGSPTETFGDDLQDAAQTQNGQNEEIATALETRNVFHHFTESEINSLNEKVTELSKKSRELSAKKKLLDSIVKGTEAEITKTIGSIDDGGEERSMECPVIINYAENTYTVKHPDTGDVLAVRPLTAAEKQRDLFAEEQTAVQEAQESGEREEEDGGTYEEGTAGEQDDE